MMSSFHDHERDTRTQAEDIVCKIFDDFEKHIWDLRSKMVAEVAARIKAENQTEHVKQWHLGVLEHIVPIAQKAVEAGLAKSNNGMFFAERLLEDDKKKEGEASR